MYRHWSFGKHFARDEALYRRAQGLAYEIVINSNPCITYIMEENTMTMQTLVMAHAAFGHNHFFKNNYLFRQWTDADGILDYLEFAKPTLRGARSATATPRWSGARRGARADGQGVHRYPRKRAHRPRGPRRSAARAARACGRPSTISGAPCPASSAAPRPTERGAAPARCWIARGEHPLLPGEEGAAAEAVAARSAAHRAAYRAVFLSAEARPR